VFPKSEDETLSKGPLELVWCPESYLLQLKHSFYANEMYGENYGYKSSLNQTMVDHLSQKVSRLETLYQLNDNDLVLDIGSNDATLLKTYKNKNIKRIGIDPTGSKFIEHYDKSINLIPDFFSADAFKEVYNNRKVKIITSIAMFYDLEKPKDFVNDINEILLDDGIWHFEQSYMPTMLRMNSYDTICHEHLEYYSMVSINILLKNCGMRILDVITNSVNGGSFAVTACKEESKHKSNDRIIEWLINNELKMGLDTMKAFQYFEERTFQHRDNLRDLILNLNYDGKKIAAYGASTKGNVLLQFCEFNKKNLFCAAEVNKEKFGRFTPGSLIPIISEAEAKLSNPDYMLVLPWHFKDNIIKRERDYLNGGGKLIFPLPEIEIVS
jgi:hypothetical protein